MLRAGAMILVLGALTGCFAWLWTAGGAGETGQEMRRWSAEFAKLGLILSLVAGVPLVLGGIAGMTGSTAASWGVLLAGCALGVAACSLLLVRFPVLRLTRSVWDSGATIGNYDRRRSILVMVAVLAFSSVLMLANVVA